MKKSHIILLIILLLTIIGGYFSYKSYNLREYSFNENTIDNYDNYISALNIKNTIKLKKNNINDNEYIKVYDLKLKNNFENFEVDKNNISTKYYLKNNKNITASLWITKNKFSETTYLEDDNDNKVINNMLKEKNIKNDLDLLNYVINHKEDKINIFTNKKDMLFNYYINMITYKNFTDFSHISLIDGDYKGYIIHLPKIDAKEVHLINNDTNYTLTFLKTDYFTESYIREIISTIEFE